jgi:hypothetical protein
MRVHDFDCLALIQPCCLAPARRYRVNGAQPLTP